jgi:hypothetical protein
MDTLPKEILCLIFEFIPKIKLIGIVRVCKLWDNLIATHMFAIEENSDISNYILQSNYYHLGKNYLKMLEIEYNKLPLITKKTQSLQRYIFEENRSNHFYASLILDGYIDKFLEHITIKITNNLINNDIPLTDMFPNEIQCLILSFLPNIDLIRNTRVCKLWKDIIEENLLTKKGDLTIEKCIMTSDFYNLKKIYHDEIKSVYDKKPDSYKRITIFEDYRNNNNEYYHKLGLLVDCNNFSKLFNHLKIKTKHGAIDINQLLIDASKADHLLAVHFLLKMGANPNHQNEYFQSALYKSCSYNHFLMTKLLLEHGAKLNIDSALRIAYESTYYGICKLLLSYCKDDDFMEIGYEQPKIFSVKDLKVEIDKKLNRDPPKN